jgi:hypothetical protein
MMLGTKGTFGFEPKPSNCGMGVSSLVEDLVFFSGANNKGIARGNLGMQTFFDHCVKTHLLWLGESHLGKAQAMGSLVLHFFPFPGRSIRSAIQETNLTFLHI